MSSAPDPTVPTWWQRVRPRLLPYLPWLTHLAVVALTALAVRYGLPPQVVEVLREVPVPAAAPAEELAGAGPPGARGAHGWVRDDEEVAAIAATLKFPVFAETPAGRAGDVPDHVYLWDYARAATGAHVPTRDQGQVGSCVAFGSACAVEYSQCVGRVAAQKAGQVPPEFRPIAQEVTYGGSRVQIGGGRIRGDGSTGAWAAKWCQQYGSVPRGKYDSFDLTSYSEPTCRKFGTSGCPAALVPVAKLAPTKSISQVKTTDECRKALASAYPVTVASDVGFGARGPYVRNAKGQLRASGTWPHQMCLIGYDATSGFYCMNSWGTSWVSGPTGPGDPPPGGFWIDEATVARMLGQGDSWAYADQVGFPGRKLDWFVRAAPARRPLDNLFRREHSLAF